MRPGRRGERSRFVAVVVAVVVVVVIVWGSRRERRPSRERRRRWQAAYSQISRKRPQQRLKSGHEHKASKLLHRCGGQVEEQEEEPAGLVDYIATLGMLMSPSTKVFHQRVEVEVARRASEQSSSMWARPGGTRRWRTGHAAQCRAPTGPSP